MERVVLRFIAGPLLGNDFPLENDCAITIGRANEAHLVISEDSVSRKHAVVTAKNGELILEDFSRNGTFINGLRVHSAVLQPRDQIQIGRSILKVVILDEAPSVSRWVIGGTPPPPAATRLARPLALLSLGGQAGDQSPTAAAVAVAPAPHRVPAVAPITTGSSAAVGHLCGSLAEIALADLVQLLTGARKSGQLVLRSHAGVGRVCFDKGRICYATLNDIDTANPQRVLYRLLRWTDGTFEFEPPDGRSIPNPITETTECLLLEAMHQLDEISNLGPDLPPLHAVVSLANPLPAALRGLPPGDLDFIQLVLRHKTVGAILDHFAGTDFEGYTYLKSLMGRRFLIVTCT